MTITLRTPDRSAQRPLSRAIVREWYSGESTIKPGEFRPTETVIRFEVRHSKHSKAYIANLTPEENGDGFSQWNSDNPGIRIITEPCARYSEKALADFSKRAYAILVENADDPRVAHVLDQIPGIVIKD